MKTDRSATFPTLLAVLLAAHEVADNLLGQTDDQAGRKDKPGAEGWCANLRHVAAYHAVMSAMVGATVRVTRVPVSGRGLLVGFVVSAASHGFIDRRWPIRRLMAATGSPAFAEMTITTSVPGMPWKPGLNRADQAAHAGMLWLAALVATRLSRVRTARDLR